MTETSPESATRPDMQLAFGPFVFLPARNLLLEGDRPIQLGRRAVLILRLLIDHAGDLVTKEHLTAEAWPGAAVEDSNLRVQIATLRRALRDGEGDTRYIASVPGRGYRFVATITMTTPAPGVANGSSPVGPLALPTPPSRPIGREDVVEKISAMVRQRRFVTVLGPGGIGKTTVALLAAHDLKRDYRHGAIFIDLVAIGTTRNLTAALCDLLGLAASAGNSPRALAASIRNRQMLVVLDSCEHVVETVAVLAAEIAAAAPEVHILTTSREPLRVAHESLYHLGPLGVPHSSDGVSAAAALTFPAIQLFVERASDVHEGYALSDADAPFACEICRSLDGIALAIELAAARVALFGVRELATRLDDRFRLLTSGLRTALPRHQTLAAVLDWSYELLNEPGRSLLCRLAVFRGEFTIDVIESAFSDIDGDPLAEFMELVAKSLVSADLGRNPTLYRLLDTTRLYGLEKLRRAGALDDARRRQFAYLHHRFAGAEHDIEAMDYDSWFATYGTHLEDLRAALEWPEIEKAEPTMFVELVLRAVPLWVALSLMGECQQRVEQALALVDHVQDPAARDDCEMRLHAAHGWSLMYTAGRADTVKSAWSRTLALADAHDNAAYRVRSLWGLWMGTLNRGDWRAAVDLAHRLEEAAAASGDASAVVMADRIVATTLHYRGEQERAQRVMERMLIRHAALRESPRVTRFGADDKVAGHYFLARILWLRGKFERARHTVALNVSEGLALGHALTFSSVLGQGACPVSFLNGDLAEARRYGQMLSEHALEHGLQLWSDWAHCFEGAIVAHEGDAENGLEIMRDALQRAGDNRLLPRFVLLLGALASCLGRVGKIPDGMKVIDDLIARCRSSEECWYIPEALRIKAELTRAEDEAGVAQKQDLLHRALLMAIEQGAVAWELRVRTDLVRSFAAHDVEPNAIAELATLARSFEDAARNADLTSAREILARTTNHDRPRSPRDQRTKRPKN